MEGAYLSWISNFMCDIRKREGGGGEEYSTIIERNNRTKLG